MARKQSQPIPRRTQEHVSRPAPSADATVPSPAPIKPKILENASRYPNGSDINDVPFSVILDWADPFLRSAMEDATEPRAFKYARGRLYIIPKVRPFWSTRCGRGMQACQDLWLEEKTRGPKGAKLWSEDTALMHMARLRGLAHKFRDAHGLIGEIVGKTPQANAAVNWYEPVEVARMLWVLRGRVWDKKKRKWKVDENGRRIINSRYRFTQGWRRRWDGTRWVSFEVNEKKAVRGQQLYCYDWLSRALLVGLWTGEVSTMVFDLRWSVLSDQSYVDLETVIEGRRGFLVRLGGDSAPGPMAGIPVAMTRRLTAHMRRWRNTDEKHGFTHVIHLNANNNWMKRDPLNACDNTDFGQIQRVLVEGGLDPCDWKRLTNSTAVWALNAGKYRKIGKSVSRFTPSRSLMRSVAFLTGHRYQEFSKKYKFSAPKFMEKQIKAMKNLPDTVK